MFVKAGPLFDAGEKAREEDRPLALEETLELPREELNATCTALLETKWQEQVAAAEAAGKRPSMFKATVSTWKKEVFLGFLLRMVMEGGSIGIPFIFQAVVTWYESPDDQRVWWHGVLYFLGLIVAQGIAFMCVAYGNEMTSTALANARSAMHTMIFKKSLRLKAGQGPKLQGKIVSLHGSDVARLKEMQWVHAVTCGPLTMIGNIIALYFFIGYSAFFSLGVLLILLPVQFKLSAMVGAFIGKMMRFSDLRVKYITEVVQGIRICKFMSWEKDFEKRIEDIRATEVQKLSKVIILRNIVISVTHVVPPMVSLSVFAGAYGIGNEITSTSVFPTLVLLLSFRNAVMGIALGVNKFIDLFEIMSRLEEFLLVPDEKPYLEILPENGSAEVSSSDSAPGGGYVCKLENATFGFMDKKSVANKATDSKQQDDVEKQVMEGEMESKEEKEAEAKTKEEIQEENRKRAVAAEAAAHADESQEEYFRPLLQDISLTFPTGSLTIVIGPTGAGKSVLVQGLLGEGVLDPQLRKTEEKKSTVAPKQQANEPIADDITAPHSEPIDAVDDRPEPAIVQRVPHVAYVPQEAWIMNATIKENITLDAPFDQARYDKAIEVCNLTADLELFPGGDATEIGERGINLSGGQKQRLALARATYGSHNFVLLDDPLSAVDPAVCQSLFNDCISGPLMEGRTRLLVTHHIQFLPNADQIVVIKKGGKIGFVGSYEDYTEYKEKEESLGNDQGTPGTGRLTPKPDTARNKEADGNKNENSGGNANGKKDGEESKLIQKEKMETGAISADVYKWYLGLAHPLHLVNCVMGFVIWRGTQMLTDIFLQLWAYRRGGFGKDSFTDNQYLMWFCILSCLTVIGTLWRALGASGLMVAISSNSHRPMLVSLLKAPTEVYDTTPVGRMLNRFSKDLQALDLILPEMSNFGLSLGIYTLSILVMMLVVAIYQLPLMILLLFIFYKILSYYTNTMRAMKRLESTERSPAMAIMSETLTGLETIRAFGLQNHFVTHHEHRVDRMMRSLFGIRAAYVWLSERTTVLSCLIFLPICTFAVLYKTVDALTVATVDDGFMMLAVAYALQLTANLSLIVMIGGEIDSQMNSAERIKEYVTDLPHEKEVLYEGEMPTEDTDPRAIMNVAAPPDNWPSSGSIEFKDAQLRYREGLPLVLKGINVKIESGMKVGVVGRTGSGKSTIMLALFRIVELAGGSIEFDGWDISNLKLEELRTKITIIPQDPTLFEGTIRSNLDPFNECSDKDIWSALKESRMWDRVKNDKDEDGNERGLDAPVAAKGSNFSVGQRQLLCLARALLRKSKILLMDEATANVDFEADAVLQETIKSAFKRHTVITIAHRLATVITNDRILVLADGVAAEFDTPLNLMDNKESIFYSMCENLGEEQGMELYKMAQQAAIAQ